MFIKMYCTSKNCQCRFILYILIQHAFVLCLPQYRIRNFQRTTFCNITALPSDVLFWPTSLVQCGVQCSSDDACLAFIYNGTKVCNLYQRGILSASKCSSKQPGAMRIFVKEARCEKGGHLQPNNTCACLTGYTGSSCESVIEDCSDGFNNGLRTDGLYWIQPRRAPAPFQVNCRMRPDGGATLIQTSSTDSDTFNRTWDQYKQGFNDTSSRDFWLGNEKIHWISANNRHVLMVEPSDWQPFRCHDNFVMAGESQNFAVTYTSSNPPYDRMPECNEIQNVNFSTYDRDNDGNLSNCASLKGAGFWFLNSDCSMCNNFTSRYRSEGNSTYPSPSSSTGPPPLGSAMSLKRMPVQVSTTSSMLQTT